MTASTMASCDTTCWSNSEVARANVIDAQGRLIFPDISLVLDNTNVTQFTQVGGGTQGRRGRG